MSDNKLYTPIQINGELDSEKSIKPENLSLLERELYIDHEGNLYFGNKNKNSSIIYATQVNANKANEATVAKNVGTLDENSFFQFDNDSKTARVGNIDIDATGKLNGKNTEAEEFTFSNSILDSSKVSTLKHLSLSDEMWGTEGQFPSNPTKGQVFFLVVD